MFIHLLITEEGQVWPKRLI